MMDTDKLYDLLGECESVRRELTDWAAGRPRNFSGPVSTPDIRMLNVTRQIDQVRETLRNTENHLCALAYMLEGGK